MKKGGYYLFFFLFTMAFIISVGIIQMTAYENPDKSKKAFRSSMGLNAVGVALCILVVPLCNVMFPEKTNEFESGLILLIVFGIVNIGMAYYAQRTFCNSGAPDKSDIVKKAASEGVKAALTDNADFVAEEIKKYKQMLDDGLISEKEFNQKRKKLLGL